MPSVFRPGTSRFLAATVAAICAIGLVSVLIEDGVGSLWTTAPWLVLVAGFVWVAFWRPQVSVDDAGVHVVNVLRTVDVTWPSIQRIDTKWALTLYTEFGSVTAWAAPAPSGLATARGAAKSNLRGLPESTYGAGQSIRPGDVPTSPSGAAASAVRTRWEELRDAGHLDDARPEHDQMLITWHWPWILGLGAVALWCIATVVG